MNAAPPDRTDPGPSTPTTRFRRWLVMILLVAVVVRVGAAIFYEANTGIGGDAVWYTGVAHQISLGNGFIEPLQFGLGLRVPTAAHPPLYPLYLSAVDLTVGSSQMAHRLWSLLPGVGTVALLGLIARDLAGPRAGLIAAALGAVSIELFTQDVLLWSEGLYGFTVALTVFVAYRYLRRPDLLHATLLSGAIAIAALTRAEAVLLFLILLVPLVLRTRTLTIARRVGVLAVAAAVAVALMAPWIIYNNVGRFEHPVGVTVTFGTLIGSSNCAATYSGPGLGGWGGLCEDTIPGPWPRDESKAERVAREAGLEYASNHLERLPVVITARLGRSFGFYAPTKSIADDLLLTEAGVHWVAYLAVAQYWLYAGLGLAGGVVLFRRRVALLPLLAPVITVATITIIGYGGMRFRFALAVVLPILAAVALDAGWRSRRRAATGTVTADS